MVAASGTAMNGLQRHGRDMHTMQRQSNDSININEVCCGTLETSVKLTDASCSYPSGSTLLCCHVSAGAWNG